MTFLQNINSFLNIQFTVDLKGVQKDLCPDEICNVLSKELSRYTGCKLEYKYEFSNSPAIKPTRRKRYNSKVR